MKNPEYSWTKKKSEEYLKHKRKRSRSNFIILHFFFSCNFILLILRYLYFIIRSSKNFYFCRFILPLGNNFVYKIFWISTVVERKANPTIYKIIIISTVVEYIRQNTTFFYKTIIRLCTYIFCFMYETFL